MYRCRAVVICDRIFFFFFWFYVLVKTCSRLMSYLYHFKVLASGIRWNSGRTVAHCFEIRAFDF